MALTPGERIASIRESSTLLDKLDQDDIDLVLEQHGFPTAASWHHDSKASYVRSMIKDAADGELTALRDYLIGEAAGGPTQQGPWTSDRLRLFCSHLAEHKLVVGNVGDQLARFGVEPFVAHDSIEPSKEWAQVIEGALADCDAMAVFLHPGFDKSKWCDQEVGWALGRQRPVLPLNFGIHPYGFLGKYQDQPCLNAYPSEVAARIMGWLVKTPSLHAKLGRGLVDVFVDSHSWNFTREVAPYLAQIHTIEDDDLTRMEKAARENVDVRECGITPTQQGPEWVEAFVAQRRNQP